MPRDAKSPAQDDQQFVRELAWKMLDGCIDEEEAEHLDLLLMHSGPARAAYVEVVSMHVDLLDHFGGLPKSEELIKRAMTTKLAKPQAPKPPEVGEIPTTEPTGA